MADVALPRYHTLGEVAKALNVSSKTVARWCEERNVEHIRTPGGQRRISSEVVAEMLRVGTVRPAATEPLLARIAELEAEVESLRADRVAAARASGY